MADLGDHDADLGNHEADLGDHDGPIRAASCWSTSIETSALMMISTAALEHRAEGARNVPPMTPDLTPDCCLAVSRGVLTDRLKCP